MAQFVGLHRAYSHIQLSRLSQKLLVKWNLPVQSAEKALLPDNMEEVMA